MRDGLTSDGVLLVVQGEDDLGDVLELLDQGFCREGIVPDKEHELQEGPEMDCTLMAYALGLFTGPQAEVELQVYQVSDMQGFGVRGGVCSSHYGVDNAQGSGLFPIDWGIFDTVSFELTVESLFQA